MCKSLFFVFCFCSLIDTSSGSLVTERAPPPALIKERYDEHQPKDDQAEIKSLSKSLNALLSEQSQKMTYCDACAVAKKIVNYDDTSESKLLESFKAVGKALTIGLFDKSTGRRIHVDESWRMAMLEILVDYADAEVGEISGYYNDKIQQRIIDAANKELENSICK